MLELACTRIPQDGDARAVPHAIAFSPTRFSAHLSLVAPALTPYHSSSAAGAAYGPRKGFNPLPAVVA